MPVSNCASVAAVEETATPVRWQQDSWGASVSAADIDPGPVMDFLGPPLLSGSHGDGGFRTCESVSGIPVIHHVIWVLRSPYVEGVPVSGGLPPGMNKSVQNVIVCSTCCVI